MRLTEARQGVRMLKFMDVFGRWEAAVLTQLEAAELLGVGERSGVFSLQGEDRRRGAGLRRVYPQPFGEEGEQGVPPFRRA
jgi:hypothetical protein